jgi:hypothetical protein
MGSRLTVREIDAYHVRTGSQQLGENLGIVGGRPERGQNFGTTEHGC